jgi:hypothetical protein
VIYLVLNLVRHLRQHDLQDESEEQEWSDEAHS